MQSHLVRSLFFLGSAGLLFLYTISLGTFPGQIHGDEAETALQALQILHNHSGMIGVGWYDLPLLSFLPHAVGMTVFGENILGDRIGSVLFGLFTILLVYFLTSQLFTKRIGVLAAILLGTSHMWIALSRMGITYVQASFFLVASLYFFAVATKGKKTSFFILAGICTGLTFYSYYAGRITPILVFPLIFSYLINNPSKEKIRNIGIAILAGVILLAPQIFFYLGNPATFFSRTNMVSIFSETGRAWVGEDKLVTEVVEQVKKSLNIFTGDTSTQYGLQLPLLDYVTLILFFLGVGVCMHKRQRNHLFLLFWLGIVLLGQIFTTMPSPFFLPRFVVGLPALFIIAALGLDSLIGKNKLTTSPFFVVILLLYIVIANIKTYFIDYQNQLLSGQTSGGLHATSPVKIAQLLNTLPQDSSVVFFSAPFLYPEHGTIRLVASQTTNNVNVKHPEKDAPPTPNTKSILYIIYPAYENRIAEIQRIFPNGDLQQHVAINGTVQFFSYKVDR